VHIARTQREPADRSADRNVDAETAAADEGDERRCVHRPYVKRPRHPAPARADAGPAAVVERRKAPWRVIDPGPTPRFDAVPAAVVIWRPVRGDVRRIPHVTIFRRVFPTAVVVEIFVADDVFRDISARRRTLVASHALRGVFIKTVTARILRDAI